MITVTIAQLRVLDAVVAEGSLQAAAERLGRTHPTIHTALESMERMIGFKLFDRSGYRLQLTADGHAFLVRARRVLHGMEDLEALALGIAAGEESALRVVIGDLTPLPATLGILKDFFADHPQTHLHMSFEALSAPWQMLLADEADVILHHVPNGDIRFETLPLGRVKLIPVAAPGFLPFPAHEARVDRLRPYLQCVIRDSAEKPDGPDYYLIEGARSCSVSDQTMKREVIVQGLGWGHMPDYLVADDLAQGRLLSLENARMQGGAVDLVVARRVGKVHGPIANRLWATIAQNSVSVFASKQARGADAAPS